MKVFLTATALDLADAVTVTQRCVATFEKRCRTSSGPHSEGLGDLASVASHYLGGETTVSDGPLTVLESETYVADLSENWQGGQQVADLVERARSASHRLVVNVPPQVHPSTVQELCSALSISGPEEFSRYVGNLDMVLTSSGDQPLIGVNGLPRYLARHGHLADEDAQELEIELGRLDYQSVRPRLGQSSRINLKSPLSGIGGGLGAFIEAAGGRVVRAGDWVTSLMTVGNPDLMVYVTDAIGLDLPAGLIALSEHARRQAIPFILVYSQGRVLRHELATFGLSGSYTFEAESPLESLDDTLQKVAQTWIR